MHAIFTRSLFGSERYAADLASRQAEAGHQVRLLIHPASPLASAVGAEVAVERLGWPARRLGLGRLVADLGADILHAHLSAACKGFGRLRRRPPAVASLHVGYKPHQHDRLDGLIALTDAAAARIHGYGGEVAHIWNWAPRLATPPSGAGEAVRRELGIEAGTFVAGFCGRLHRAKDPLLLMRAFLAARLPDAVLVMAGDGPERATADRIARGQPSIRLLGYRTDVSRLYEAFDLLVLPSRVEQAPLVLFEAMAAGLPIIATRIEGPEEILAPTPARLFPSGDEAALTSLLVQAFARGRRRERYDLAAFDPAAQAGKVTAFYERVIAARAARGAP